MPERILPAGPFHLIELGTSPEGFTFTTFQSVTALCDRLRQLSESEYADTIQVIIVRGGDRCFLSKGYGKHLLVPGEEPIPYLRPPDFEPDSSGFVYHQ